MPLLRNNELYNNLGAAYQTLGGGVTLINLRVILFVDCSTICWLDCTASAGKMNNELERIKNEADAEYFEIIPGKLLTGGKKPRKLQSVHTEPASEPIITPTDSRSANQ